jgi:hypothetical protein
MSGCHDNSNRGFPERKKPNFFIVGAPKAGTTSLYYNLQQHPDIFLSDPKETNFFSYKEIEGQNLYYRAPNISTFSKYKALFNKVNDEKIIGEASVSYLYYKPVAERIHSFNPEAKIVILLRNPTYRAYSHYLMDHRLGLIDIPFEDVIFKKRDHKYLHLYYQQYVKLGLYEKQIARYLDYFGDDVKIYLMKELQENAKELLMNLFQFLNIKEIEISTIENRQRNSYIEAKYDWVRNLYGHEKFKRFLKSMISDEVLSYVKKKVFDVDAVKPEMTQTTKRELKKLYKPDIKATEKLINRSLSHWYN